MRTIYKKNWRHPAKRLFKNFGVLTLPVCYAFKLIMNTHGKELATRGDVTGRVTRQSNQLDLARCRLERTKKSPSYMGARLYNELPEQWKEKTFGGLRRTLKEFLIKAAPYSTEEVFTLLGELG